MTDAQLYIAIGLPSMLFALNFVAILWQSRGVEKSVNRVETALITRIAALEQIMNAKFEAHMQALLRVEGVLDARLKHLEEKER